MHGRPRAPSYGAAVGALQTPAGSDRAAPAAHSLHPVFPAESAGQRQQTPRSASAGATSKGIFFPQRKRPSPKGHRGPPATPARPHDAPASRSPAAGPSVAPSAKFRPRGTYTPPRRLAAPPVSGACPKVYYAAPAGLSPSVEISAGQTSATAGNRRRRQNEPGAGRPAEGPPRRRTTYGLPPKVRPRAQAGSRGPTC